MVVPPEIAAFVPLSKSSMEPGTENSVWISIPAGKTMRPAASITSAFSGASSDGAICLKFFYIFLISAKKLKVPFQHDHAGMRDDNLKICVQVDFS